MRSGTRVSHCKFSYRCGEKQGYILSKIYISSLKIYPTKLGSFSEHSSFKKYFQSNRFGFVQMFSFAFISQYNFINRKIVLILLAMILRMILEATCYVWWGEEGR